MKMCKSFLSTVLMATMLTIVMAVTASAETFRPKVDNFILFFDHSGSMVLTSPDWSGLKLKMAKELAGKMNAEIPNLAYTSGVNSFAPFSTELALRQYNKAAVAEAVKGIDTTYDPYGRTTPLGFGLDKIDRKYLLTIIDKFGGGPVGVETLAAGISEEVETIEDVYEPYLMQIGFIERTPRGRMVTPSAATHVGRKLKDDKIKGQEKLFR